MYYSTDCQKSNWPEHRKICRAYPSRVVGGKTVRIDLRSFYPYLACLVDRNYMFPDKPYPGLLYKILNDVNPGAGLSKLPDESTSKLLDLGDRITDDFICNLISMGWWPTAISMEGVVEVVEESN